MKNISSGYKPKTISFDEISYLKRMYSMGDIYKMWFSVKEETTSEINNKVIITSTAK